MEQPSILLKNVYLNRMECKFSEKKECIIGNNFIQFQIHSTTYDITK